MGGASQASAPIPYYSDRALTYPKQNPYPNHDHNHIALAEPCGASAPTVPMHIHACVHTYMHAATYTYTHTHTHTRTHTHACMHTCKVPRAGRWRQPRRPSVMGSNGNRVCCPRRSGKRSHRRTRGIEKSLDVAHLITSHHATVMHTCIYIYLIDMRYMCACTYMPLNSY